MSSTLAGRTLSSRLLSSADGRAVVGATTGSPILSSGKGGRPLLAWTGSGTVTFSVPGLVRVVTVGGGRPGDNVAPYEGGTGGEVLDYLLAVEAATYDIVVGAGGLYVGQTAAGPSSFASANRMSMRTRANPHTIVGNAGLSADATGLYTDISGSSVGYGGAGYGPASTNYSPAFGGCPASGPLRANSGGGGGQGDSIGNGANGVVMLLT